MLVCIRVEHNRTSPRFSRQSVVKCPNCFGIAQFANRFLRPAFERKLHDHFVNLIVYFSVAAEELVGKLALGSCLEGNN